MRGFFIGEGVALKVEKVKISEIKTATYNPRQTLKPGDVAWEKIAGSLERFGMLEPVIINGETGTLVSGHQRLSILKEQGKTTVDALVLKLDDTQEKVLNLSLNKIKGDWDYDKLTGILQELQAAGADLDDTGFDDFEIKTLLTDYDHISDLMEDDFSGVDSAAEKPKDTFNMTFTLPAEAEQAVKDFCIDHGKDTLAETIIAEAGDTVEAD